MNKDKIIAEVASRDFLMGFATGLLSNLVFGVIALMFLEARRK